MSTQKNGIRFSEGGVEKHTLPVLRGLSATWSVIDYQIHNHSEWVPLRLSMVLKLYVYI